MESKICFRFSVGSVELSPETKWPVGLDGPAEASR